MNKRILIFSPEGRQTNLILPACLYRSVDIPVLDGKIAGIIQTMDATRGIGHHTEPLLAVLTPGAYYTILLLRLHD